MIVNAVILTVTLRKRSIMLRIALITGSTSPGRNNEAVARWVFDLATNQRKDVKFELVDMADYKLSLLDEPVPPSFGQYNMPTQRFGLRKLLPLTASCSDAGLQSQTFRRSEKRHRLFAEWNNKAAGFVSYASAGGARAVEHLRLILAELMVAIVRKQVMLSLFTDFENFSTFKPMRITNPKLRRCSNIELPLQHEVL